MYVYTYIHIYIYMSNKHVTHIHTHIYMHVNIQTTHPLACMLPLRRVPTVHAGREPENPLSQESLVEVSAVFELSDAGV